MTSTIAIFNGIPSFFRCSCQEASTGGARGYRQAGWALAQNLYRLIPDDLDRDGWLEQLDELETLLRDERPDDVAAWLQAAVTSGSNTTCSNLWFWIT